MLLVIALRLGCTSPKPKGIFKDYAQKTLLNGQINDGQGAVVAANETGGGGN